MVAQEVGGSRQSATAKVKIRASFAFSKYFYFHFIALPIGGGQRGGHERQPAAVRQGGVQGHHQGEHRPRHKDCSGKTFINLM